MDLDRCTFASANSCPTWLAYWRRVRFAGALARVGYPSWPRRWLRPRRRIEPQKEIPPMSATPVATPETTEAAEAAVEAIAGAASQDVTFSLAAHPGPEGHPRLGARLRRRRDAPRRPRVGREGADAVADHPGGRQDRPLRLRRPGAVLRRPDRPDAADRQRGAVLGRRRHRHGDHGHLARRRRDLRPGHGRADRRVDPALLRHARRRQGRRLLRLGAQRRLRRLRRAHQREVRRGRRRVGASTARRRGPPTAASPTSTS